MKTISVLGLLFFAAANSAAAQVYKSVDAKGRVVFSDQPSAGATKLDAPPKPAVSTPKPAAASQDASDDSAQLAKPTEKKPDFETRRKEIEERLARETERLESARSALAEAQALISGEERNSQADVDRQTQLGEEVTRLEKSVATLKEQLSAFK